MAVLNLLRKGAAAADDPATRSWRDPLPIHPATDLFPMMSSDELKALGEDSKRHRLRNCVAIMEHIPERADGSLDIANSQEFLLDGPNRLDAIELLGCSLFDQSGHHKWEFAEFVDNDADFDPYAYVVSVNIHRRHLTAEKKRELIAEVIKAQPEKSALQISKITKSSPHTVIRVRDDLVAKGDVCNVQTSIDTKGRQQPAKKERKAIAQPKPIATTPSSSSLPPAPLARDNETVSPNDSRASLAVLVEQLRGEKRILEIKVVGLESEIEDLRAQLAQAKPQPGTPVIDAHDPGIPEFLRRGGVMFIDEIRGHISTALDRDGMSASQTANLIKDRISSATADQLFAAAIAELREQAEHIDKPEVCIDKSTDELSCLEEEIADLKLEIKGLRARKSKEQAAP